MYNSSKKMSKPGLIHQKRFSSKGDRNSLQVTGTRVLCTEDADNKSAPQHPCDGGLLVPVAMNSFAPGVNWWRPLGLPSDSGRVWVSCSADGPVIRRRDRRAHSLDSLSAPHLPVGLLTDRTALSPPGITCTQAQ